METLTADQQKIKLIKQLADLKKTDIGKDMSPEEFDYLYDMSLEELVETILALRTLIAFKQWLNNATTTL